MYLDNYYKKDRAIAWLYYIIVARVLKKILIRITITN